MKKLFIVILSVIASACLFVGFAGCNDNGQNHVHTYSTEWSFDETYHWHKATCDHKDEVSDKAEHTATNGKCSVCGCAVAEKRAVMKIDVEKVLKAFADNAYTISATKDDGTIRIALSAKDLFVKVTEGDNKALIDESGMYIFSAYNGQTSYIAIDKLVERLFEQATGMKFSTFVSMVNYMLPEGWTTDDLIAIVWDGEKFAFDSAKATALLEDVLFNEGITVAQVEEMAEDGLTYEEVAEILKPEIIESINNALPEDLTLEGVMPYFANITPAKVKALFDAFCAGELNADYINALLPDGITLDTVKLLFPEINIDDIIEKVNSVVKFINSIDFEKLFDEIEQTMIKAFNKAFDLLFIEENVDAGVKYTLNYGIIKDANQYLNDTMLETIINSVLGDEFVDDTAAYLSFLLDSKLCDLKTMVEGAIGITLEALLDEIDKYAEEFAPTINQIINSIIEEQSYATNVDVLTVIKGATAMARTYLADEEFMGRTLGETIEMFSGEENMTVEQIKGYITTAVEFLKANTVYDVLFNVGVIKDKADLYNRINEFADMLTENYPVYFVINASGELEELSAEIVDKKMSILVQKGDKIGEIFTAEEKEEISSAATKYTLEDFKGYEYTYINWADIELTVKVEITAMENGLYVITRTDGDIVESTTYTYSIDGAALNNDFIEIGEDDEIIYSAQYYNSDYDEFDSLSIVFDKDGNSYLKQDYSHFVSQNQLEAA
ncbi:MAG: hypothetical protein IJQ07_08720 [Clostridia bacterium]|nr:hypothetical protein [Clostridia bacterium]